MSDETATAIPAQPGFVLLQWWPPQEGYEDGLLDRLPVVAWEVWRMGEHTFVNPLTVRGHDGTLTPKYLAVLQPDGRIIDDTDQNAIFTDEDDWLGFVRERWERREERMTGT